MHRYWMIKDDRLARIDADDKDSDEYKFLIEKGWKVKFEELICTDDEMHKFLDKVGPSDFEEIKKAFPKHKDSELRNALSSLVYTAKTVDTMHGLTGKAFGVFVTARYQKNWAEKIAKHRSENKPILMVDLPCPDTDPISTCNKVKVSDEIRTKPSPESSAEVENISKPLHSIELTKVTQKEMRKNIIDKSTKENLHDFNSFIDGLDQNHKCYWNEYLDDFKRKLIITEIKKKTQGSI